MKSYEERLSQATGIYKEGLRKVTENPQPPGQKFDCGTFVWIEKDLGQSMSHFRNDRPAQVEYVYGHAYDWSEKPDIESYSLLVRNDDGTWSSSSWYYEHQLTQINDQEKIKNYLDELNK